jgi:predicted metal-dependent phosphoesterase TrpH
MCGVPLLERVCRECYNHPEDVYETLKRRGMDLVTVTDHDSIDAVETLRRKPDFFLSEEVSALTPDGNSLHIGVYGINERQHIGLQSRRNDFFALLAYIREHDLPFSLNHVFSSLTGRRSHDDFRWFATLFPAVETLNGHIPAALNRSAAAFAAQWRKAFVGGSDSHTLQGLGRTYTEIRGARNIGEFLSRLRAGQGQAYGENGTYWKLTRVVWEIGCSMGRETPWTALLAPLLLAVPLVTIVNLVREHMFNYRWSRRAWHLRDRLLELPAEIGELPL